MGAFRTDWDTAANPRYDVWTVTNGGEILPGVLTPFTGTFFSHLDEAGIKALMKPYATRGKVSVYRRPIANFFGVAAGRLILNVGFSVAAMSGLDPDIATAMASQFFQGSDDALKLIIKAKPEEYAAAHATATAQREAAEGEARAIQAHLYAARAAGQAAQDRALSPKAAWKRWQALLPGMIDSMNRHLIVSTAAGEMQVRLAGVIAVGGGDPNTIVGLCSGLGNVESSKPALALYDLAQVAKKSAIVRSAVERGDAPEVLAGVRNRGKGWAAFAAAFDGFLQQYGFRVQGEADPTVADWSEDPTFVVSQVKSMMALSAADSPAAHIRKAAAARARLERQVRASLTPDLRPVYDAALVQAQRFTAMRELTKAVWVLSMRQFRPLVAAMADGLAAAGAIKTADDFVYLTYDEAKALVAGTTVDGVRASISRRRRQRAAAENWLLPNSWIGDAKPTRKPKVVDATTLAGLGVSAGRATGPARIIMNTEAAFARDIEPGDVLVAPFTDTPWTPLFIPAAAVVVETGGMLSHAATVAREFGIPCVVLVADATRVIHEGDIVTVDGATGVITIDRRA